MGFLVVLVLALIAAFAIVVFFGAPYLPTLEPQIKTAFALLKMQPGQTLLELGSGDGKVLLAAAKAGYNAVGVELNPFLVLISLYRTRRYRRQVRVIWGNYWKIDWPEADGVFVFLLDRFMPKLNKRMETYKKPLVSIAFQIPGKDVAAEKNGVFLYHYY